MQNEKTLIELGFLKLDTGEGWIYRGKYQKFIAKVITFNGPFPYVDLKKVCKEIDMRPKSTRFGHHYLTPLKDCCSAGSVERAINKYDVPEEITE